MTVQAPAPYYRIRLDSLTGVTRVRSNRREQFRYRFSGKTPEVFEINFIQEGNLCELRENGEKVCEQGTVHTIVNNRSFIQYSTAPVLHEFYMAHKLSSPAEPMTEEEVAAWTADGTEAILPEYITDPALCRRLSNLIKGAVSVGSSSDPLRELKLRSCLYECLVLLTEYAVQQVKNRAWQDPASVSRYTQKACKYIGKHLSEKFTVADVAKAAGISYNHLKNVFLRDTRLSIVEYINRQRIRTVEHLITVDGMTLEEAGQLVGITDPSYLSRLFRRCTGMSVREYRRVYSERLNYGHTI